MITFDETDTLALVEILTQEDGGKILLRQIGLSLQIVSKIQ